MAFKMKTTKVVIQLHWLIKLSVKNNRFTHLVPNLNHNNGLKKENQPRNRSL